MKTLTKLGLFLLIIVSCYSNKNGDKKAKDFQKNKKESQIKVNKVQKKNVIKKYNVELKEIRNYAISYKLKDLDLANNLNDSLKHFNLDSLFQSGQRDSLLDISKIFLLRLYKYHLQRANRGYNLLDMRKGSTKTIIDFYLKQDTLDSTSEFINSGYIYEVEKEKKQNDSIIIAIMADIKKEIQRINNEAKEAIKKFESY